ncbi:MAG: hypothetical protein KAH32_08460 [Chlamydiia bacterium]|nr:hypothetical protein [Chlamydiia bacterium]
MWKEEWEGWNTFLGVDNTFDGYDRAYGQAYDWMDFWEAVKYVQGLGLGSKMEYLREHRAGNIPKNIPMSPDTLKLWNDKWRGIGWKGWLGKSLTGHIEAIRNVEKIVCVCNVSDYEPNMLEVVVAVGLLGLEEIKEREDLSIRKMYLLEDGDEEILRYVLKMGSKQGKDLYMFSNVNEFLYEMDNSLLMYRKL